METREVGPPRGGADLALQFDDFVGSRSSALLRTAHALTGDLALAEDLLQTSLVQAWRFWGRIHTSHEAFVRKTMVNTYLSWWRRRWNGEQPAAELPESAADVADLDVGMDLIAAVHDLPRRQRAVVVLRYYEDLPDAEIADLLGCSAATVRSQAHRALARLGNNPNLQEDQDV